MARSQSPWGFVTLMRPRTIFFIFRARTCCQPPKPTSQLVAPWAWSTSAPLVIRGRPSNKSTPRQPRTDGKFLLRETRPVQIHIARQESPADRFAASNNAGRAAGVDVGVGRAAVQTVARVPFEKPIAPATITLPHAYSSRFRRGGGATAAPGGQKTWYIADPRFATIIISVLKSELNFFPGNLGT